MKEYYIELRYLQVLFWEYFDSVDSTNYKSLYNEWKGQLSWGSLYSDKDYLKVLLF
jgi:hypothetical protein